MQGVTNASPNQAAVGQSTITASDPKATGGDFETFLKLLTAQMRNQDPLKPMDSTAFVAQLASFSAVEQQIQTNVHLENLLGAFSGGSSYGLSEWIGKEVKHTGPSEYYGHPKDIAVSIDQNADQAALVARNDAGIEIDRMQISSTAKAVLWAGGQNGDLPFGTYNFTVESIRNGEVINTSAAEVYDLVNEVRIGHGEADLILEGGVVIPASDVASIRRPQV